jgi:hypothetical protein
VFESLIDNLGLLFGVIVEVKHADGNVE